MGKYWNPLLEKKREALRDPDWRNMRANALTANIDDSNRSWVNEANHARLTRQMWAKAEHRLGDEFGTVSGREYPYGNPYTVELRHGLTNGLTSFASSRAALDYAVMLSTMCLLTAIVGQPKVVVEIGGGYGGLAVRGMQLWPKATWWDVDFEEMTKIASHYVHHCRDSPKFRTLDVDGSLPVTNFPKLVSTADLVINTRSMMEMDLDEVNWYLGALQEWLRPGKLFYCLNRDKVTRMGSWDWDDRWSCLWRQPWPTNPQLTEMLLVRAGKLF